MEVTLTKENFEKEVLGYEGTVLVDFWASWCAPCRMLSPVISELAEDYAGRIKVGKVNVDDEEELAFKFGISSIPTVMIFKNGKAEQTLVGFRSKEEFEELLG